MALEFQIPVGIPYWSQRVELDGQTYYIALRHNPRIDRWFFSLSDSLQQPLIEGRKVLPKRDLLAGIAAQNIPPGMLLAPDFTDTGLIPNEANFDGAQTALVYVPYAESYGREAES